MKFSRQKMQHLKWLRRKEFIRINCFIMIAILLLVLLFMGFPIVSNAEEASVPSGYIPLVSQYPDFDFDNMITQADFDILYPDDDINDYYNCLFDEEGTVPEWFSADYFDGDSSNGEIFIDSSLLSQDLKCYIPHYVESGRIDRYDLTGTMNVTSLPNLVLGYSVVSGSSLPSLCFFSNHYKLYSLKSTTVVCTLLDVSSTQNGQNPSRMNEYAGYKCRTVSFAYNGHTCYCFTSNNTSSNAQIGYPSTTRYSANYSDQYGYTACDMMVAFGTDCHPICCSCVGSNDRVYLTEKLPNNADSSVVKSSDGVYSSDVWGHDYHPVYNTNDNGGSGLDSQNILNGDFIYDNSNIFVSGQSSNNFDLVVVLDFPESTNFTQFDYVLNLNSTVSVDFLHQYQAGNKNANFTAYYGTQTYGSGLGDSLFDNNQFAFSGSYQGSIESNVFKIPSSTLNTFMIDSYNANNVAGPADYVVNPSEFFNRVSQLKVANYYNIPEVLQRSIIDSLGIKTSMPYYQNDDSFKINTAVFTYSLDLYKDGTKITSVPLACEYDVINGTSTVTSNPGYNKDVVNQVVTDNNNDVNNDPTNPNYKNPDNYLPTVQTEPNVPSDQTNNNNNSNNISGGNNSVNVVNSPSVTISQGNKYPEKGVMQSFVRIINNDKNNTVNDIDTLIGGSSYIQLMNNALVAVPDTVWNIWITVLKAILGIAVSAFFLKILINWAT